MSGGEHECGNAGEQVTVLVRGEETGGKLTLLEVKVRRGAEPPLHLHHWDDEIVYVLEGEVTFHLDGERLPRPAGTHVLLSREHEHSYSVESGEARLLVAAAPAGIERFYGEMYRCGAGAGLDVEQFVTLGARHGVEITGPPPGPASRRGCAPSAED